MKEKTILICKEHQKMKLTKTNGRWQCLDYDEVKKYWENKNFKSVRIKQEPCFECLNECV